MRRGEVWWAKLPSPAGCRPVVLLSRNEAYLVRELVTVAPVTSRMRQIAVEVSLGPGDGMPKHCLVNLDTINTIGKKRLVKCITTLSGEKLRLVERALKFALGIGE